MEVQVLDNPAPVCKSIRPAQHCGSIYDVFSARQGLLRPTGGWNACEITASGRRIGARLNGTLIVDADLDTVKDPGVLERHPGLARTMGHIGVLGHKSRVEFRNVRLRELT
jgi:hypothetical protein